VSRETAVHGYTVLLRSEQTGGHGSVIEIAAGEEGVEPPPWARRPSPEVVFIGPRIGEEA